MLTACGASVGDGYGPRIVAREPLGRDDLRGIPIAVPGLHTTAYTALAVLLGPGSFEPVEVPFQEITDRVDDGTFTAGLVIHEAPWVSPRSEGVLAEGSVLTVEPGVYLLDHGGVRIEDTVVVTPAGSRTLTQSPKTVTP